MHDNVDLPGTGKRCRQGQDGISMADVLELPPHLRDLVTWMMRRAPCTMQEIASRLDNPELDTPATVSDLIERGFVNEIEGERYLARPTTRSRRKAPRSLMDQLEGLGDG